MRFFTVCLTTLTILATASVGLAATIHVPADQPTIQAGIDTAVDGDTVLVADGTYTGDGNRDIDFPGKAIVLMSENGAENCVRSGSGNIDTDPLFLNPYDDDYHLQAGSPCIDAGDPTYEVPSGGGCRIDMGAYEYWKGFNCWKDKVPVQWR